MPIHITSTQLKDGPFFLVSIDINKAYYCFEINDPNARVSEKMNDFMNALKNKKPHSILLVLDDENDICLYNGTYYPGSYLKLEYNVERLDLTSAYGGRAYLSKFHVYSQANHDKPVEDINRIFMEITKVRNQAYDSCVMDMCNFNARALAERNE